MLQLPAHLFPCASHGRDDRQTDLNAGGIRQGVWSQIARVVTAVGLSLACAAPSMAASTDVVISQVYGGGGNTGATYKNDFIELHNRGASAISLNGWSVQYASATGTSWQVTALTNVTLQPGQYYLVQEAAGTGGTTSLPAADKVGTIAMSGTAGKVALVTNSTALPCGSACSTNAAVKDYIGFGATANNYEGIGPAPAPSNTTAALRASNGCTDTDNNNTDFTAVAPAPRNTATTAVTCSVPAVNGACGTDNAQTLAASAPTNLCIAGTASAITGSGHPWNWSCDGSGGGTNASCSASIQSYSLNFATDGNGTLTGATSQTVDFAGSATAVSATANSGYAFSNWTGTGGFATTGSNPLTVGNVTAAQTITANFTNAPIVGVCGSSNGQARATAPTANLCATGGATAVIGTGPWNWGCNGLNGGAAASCSASLDTTAHFQDFSPIADAQVAEALAATNYATDASMRVASANGGTYGNQRIWSAFDLSGKLPPGASITSAKLRMYVYQAATTDLPVAVHGSSDDAWTETGITWATQPAFDGVPVASGDLPANGEYKWVEFDVTPHVLARMASGNRINLMVKAATEGAATWVSNAIDSKDFNASLAPRLRIEYAGGVWPDDKINIIHVNDIHSRLTTHDLDFPDASGESPAFEEAGGAARMAAKILALKSANMNSLILDAGDISEGGPLGDLRVNGGMVDYLDNIDSQLKGLGGRGIDAIVIGNHDVRDAQMIANMQASGLPFIAVNMLNFGATVPTPSAWPAANKFRPYVIVDTISSAGTPTKVAVLGYLTDDSAILSASTETLISVKETRWTSANADHVKLKDWVDYLRNTEHADVVVLLSHVGHRRYNSGDEVLLGDGDVSPPDLVVSGHWHTWGKTVWQPSNLNYNTAVVEAASYAQYVGEVQLTPKGEYLSAQKHPIKAAEITPNAGVQTLIDTLIAEYDAQVDPAKACVLPTSVTGRANANQACPLEHVVGYSAVDLKLDKDKWFTLSEFPWSGDNAAGEWIADATVWKLGQLGVSAQLALQSGGGVRRDVKAGPITYLDIYETYPWTDDQIRVVTLTSADIWNYLESHYVGSSISKGWQVSANDGDVTAITYDADGSGPGAPVAISKTDTSTTWQVAISEYMFLHDDWINESGGSFVFSTKPNTAYTQSIRNSVVQYTSQFTAANPMTVEGPRYVLNTELAGGFKAVVTMVSDAENEPYFEGVFIRLIEALPETVARRASYGLASLVNADGSINADHEFAETMLYRAHLGFPDGMLKVGDIIEVWGEGGFFAGNPQLVDQESVYAPGKEFSILGNNTSLAQPEFQPDTAAFFDEAHENRLVKFRAVRTGDQKVTDANGVQINVYKEGGYYSVGKLPGVNGDLLELVGVQTQRTGSSPDRRFRLREASVVPTGGNNGGYLPFSAVNAVSSDPVATGPITLTAAANDAATGGNGTLSIAPAADAQVASGYPGVNYNTTNLYIQSAASGYGNERDWLRFDLTGSLPAGASATGARLKLFQWKASGVGLPVAVHGSGDTAWAETAITWNTQPAFDAIALASQTVSTLNTWYSWDVGSYVVGKSAVSFVAKPVTENAATALGYAFDAKEYGSNAPALEVDYTAPLSTASVASVRFFYRYAADGLNWGAWTSIGTDTTPAAWDMAFNFPNGAGHYEFYSVATDNEGNVQPTPLLAQSSVHYNSSLIAQSIGFASLQNRALDDSPFAVTATGGASGNPVVFSSLTSGVCSVSGASVTLLTTGTCSIAANQAGNASYSAASQVVRSFSVQLGQIISFAPLADRAVDSGVFSLTASASSGLSVTYASLSASVCTVSGSTVTLLAAGSCTIAAEQTGDASYAPAATVAQSFNVVGATNADSGDVPLPAWALFMLGAGLVGAMRRKLG
ncbi:MAG: hypothetical protein B7Y41_15635 [Hydrogenophilales bacterium 28-61-23]|nr:MAG: hypothetical protein B7Y41_15635 [Hydrogenophilales bacterium 28-61-23]